MAGKRIARIAAAALVIVLAGGVTFVTFQRGKSVRAFFRLERKWNEHWPFERGKNAIQDIEPLMRAIGLLRPVRVEVERGMSLFLDPRDLVPLTILRTREWQPEVWNALAPALGEGGVFFDVGAHIGYFSLKAALRVGPGGRVVAFEPNPEILKQLRDNVAANRAGNVIVEPIACTDHEQMLTLYAAPEINTGASSLARENAEISEMESPRAYSVRGRPIDDVVKELGLERVDAIKVDVEGAEVGVLRGAENTLRRFHPKLVVEMIPRQLASFHTTPEELRSVLAGDGYNLSRPLNAEEADWEWSRRELASTIRMSDPSAAEQLIRGFYSLEQNSWRWTAPKFTVALKPPPEGRDKGGWLVLNFVIPDVAFSKLKGVAVRAASQGVTMVPENFSTPGKHAYRAEMPAAAFRKDIVTVDFALDRFLQAREYGRDLGLVVTSIGFEPK